MSNYDDAKCAGRWLEDLANTPDRYSVTSYQVNPDWEVTRFTKATKSGHVWSVRMTCIMKSDQLIAYAESKGFVGASRRPKEEENED